MSIVHTAFFLGLAGSFHCVGMCGPIALSLPLRGDSVFRKIWGSILWSAGRIVTYSLIGALFGVIGEGFKLIGFQQVISIAIGILMIFTVILPSVFKNFSFGHTLPFIGHIRNGMKHLFQGKNLMALFLIGIFNGLLPCGLVYLAVAGAIGTADLWKGIAYMALFGLGTLPMLLAISMFGNIVSLTFRKKINKVVPAIVIIIGIIFILRGLTLGIPFLSPPKEKLTPTQQMELKDVQIKTAVEHSCCEPQSGKKE
jgi:uncharacterized protein